jgi:hypothetical protein
LRIFDKRFVCPEHNTGNKIEIVVLSFCNFK